MRKIYSYILVLTLIVFISSCKDDFLKTNPTEQITDERIKELSNNPSVGAELQDALTKGIYTWMYTPEAGGTSGSGDFGQKSIDIMLDILSGDMVKPANDYGWFGNLQRYISTANKADLANYQPWRYYYRLIFTANSIIESLGDTSSFPDTPDGLKRKHVYGQALGVRGYAYFYLTQLFAAKYEPAKALVPIYVDRATLDHKVASQKEVYDQAISDLSKSAEYLKDFTRNGKYQMSTDVANSYLAYLYGAMGNYTEVEKLTKSIMNNSSYSPMTASEIVYTNNGETGTGFNDVNIKGWMWATDMNTDMGIDLYSWWGQCDIYTYSYAVSGEPKVMDNVLYNSMRDDDIRRKQFGEWEDFEYVPFNKFYHKDRVESGQRNIDADLHYLRVSEMYLLHIESLARLDKEGQAKTELKSFLTGRIGDLSYIDALSGQSLLDEIYKQTRIELWGEGKSYLAMKRFKATVHFGDNRFDTDWRNQSMAYDDERMYFKIPENEELNNTNLYK